jgi:mannose PTS system EIIA component
MAGASTFKTRYNLAMIGILIVAHGSLGECLIDCATHVMGKSPPHLRYLAVAANDCPAMLLPRARDLVKGLDQGAGVLVLTDIFGATPANVACCLLVADRVAGVAGVNLPMLIRALNYRECPLAVVAEKARSGGQDGVIVMPFPTADRP